MVSPPPPPLFADPDPTIRRLALQALVALRSWHPKADRSTVVPFVDEPVTSFQMSAVVTEQGVAAISGCDQRSQALNLIEQAAHPRARESLHRRARELHIL